MSSQIALSVLGYLAAQSFYLHLEWWRAGQGWVMTGHVDLGPMHLKALSLFVTCQG